MQVGKNLFAQLLEFVPRTSFARMHISDSKLRDENVLDMLVIEAGPCSPACGPGPAAERPMRSDGSVIVMAKAPLPGYAKTRLIPALGAAGAAALAQQMLEHAVAQAVAAGLGAVDLCCAPNHTHAAFAGWAQQPGIELSSQAEGDLGARMKHAFDRWWARSGRVLMIGADAPAIDAAMLRHAAQALDDTDAVFVPAFDGGYALIGLRRASPTLFEGIAWSTPSVMAVTRSRVRAAGLRHVELATVTDIDEPADLAHVPPSWLAGRPA